KIIFRACFHGRYSDHCLRTNQRRNHYLVEDKMKAYGNNASSAKKISIKSIDECKIVVHYSLYSKDKQGKEKELRFEEILPTNIDRILHSNDKFPGHFVYREENVITNHDGSFLDKSRTSVFG